MIKTAIIALVVYWQHAYARQVNGSCYPVDCQLSRWSKWSACTTPCGISGTQSSDRHRVITEECGGTCWSTFRKTRACPKLNCLNGGSLQNETCFCKENYSGVCCQEAKTRATAPIVVGTGASGICLGSILYISYRYYKFCRPVSACCREL